ncbi:hypothetical protein ADN00_01345 [Ornatilinea apprima]|uniref:N-acetyltransferase domain-containing protein n=1 Tax=Ornatilinea apprima TaxID=1134406 RepID=A0A0P6XXC2_9CHLR|nr:GNAT family N-acetyltransferase [Ornatilinea apprima]KPL80521.1 hypothetical protein ADN00_01345 [Ornatilinea apprima]
MKLEELREIFDHQQRVDVDYPDIQREDGPLTVRHINLRPAERGFVIYSRLDESNADAAIEAEIARFRAAGQDFTWKVYDHDTPPDLKARLTTRGFSAQELEAVLVLDMDSAPPAFFHPPAQTARRLSDPEAVLAAFEAVEVPVWQDEGMRELGALLVDEMLANPQELSFFAVYAQEQPVSLAWIRYHPGTQFASLWGGSTLEAYRGQGAYQALLAARAIEARQRGARFLTVDASPMSEPILLRRGFQPISRAQDFEYTFEAGPV